MVRNWNDYVIIDDIDDGAEFRYKYRDNMIAQFEQDFFNKSFSLQDQDNRDDGLLKRYKFWFIYVLKMGGPILKMFMILNITILE